MARKCNLHGKGFEKNASVDPVSSLESSGIPSKKMGSRSVALAIHEGYGNNNENAQNVDFPENQSNTSRNKSQRSKGSGDSKHGVGIEEPNTYKGGLEQKLGTKLMSSKSKEVSTSKENGKQVTVGYGD